MSTPTKDKRDVILEFHSCPDAILNALNQTGWQVIPKATPRGERSVEYIGKHIDVEHFGASSSEPPKENPCPISYKHLPHDYCDGKPTAPAIGEPPKEERGEWTGERVKNLWLNSDPAKSFFDYIADTINAAIKAEREQVERIADFAAEVVDKAKNLQQQLLATQAAIKQHNYWCEKSVRACTPIDVDLSALEQYREEVRKPLVDLLELALHEMRHAIAPRNSFTEVVDKLDAELASVKEKTI